MQTQPFAYSRHTDEAKHLFQVTPGNTPPALVVLLFLVTDPNHLKELDKVGDVYGEFEVKFTDIHGHSMTIAELATLTGLTKDSVRDILRLCYLVPTIPGVDPTTIQEAFRTVSEQFQAFEAERIERWDQSECPGIVGIKALAENGAIVDPMASLPMVMKSPDTSPRVAEAITA